MRLMVASLLIFLATNAYAQARSEPWQQAAAKRAEAFASLHALPQASQGVLSLDDDELAAFVNGAQWDGLTKLEIGANARPLCRQGSCLFVDSNKDALQQTADVLVAVEGLTARYVHNSAEAMHAIPDGVAALLVLKGFPWLAFKTADARTLFAELDRVLVPGGRLLVLFNGYSSYALTNSPDWQASIDSWLVPVSKPARKYGYAQRYVITPRLNGLLLHKPVG